MGKRLKRLSSFILVVTMMISMAITSFGQDFSIDNLQENLEKMDLSEKLGDAVVLMVNSPKAYDSLYEFDIDYTNNQITPVLKDNKTLVPVRFISESLYADVHWDGETSTVTIELGDRVTKLVLGSKEMIVNGRAVPIETPAQLIQGSTFVPLRAIAEALGKEVFYDRGLIIISDIENIFDISSDRGYIDAIISMFTGEVPKGYNYDYYYTMAELFCYSHLDEKAIKYADQLIEIRPNSTEYYTKVEHAYEVKATLLLHMGEYEESLLYYDKAIAIDPSNDYFYYSKGIVLYEMGKYEEALALFDKSIDMDTYWLPYYETKISVLLQLERNDEIIKLFYDLIELNMNSGEWIYKCASDMWGLGFEEEAIKLFDKAISENKNNIQLYEHKGAFLYMIGDFEESIEVLDKVLQKDKSNFNANIYTYSSLWQLGEYSKAVVFLETAVEIMPSYSKELYDNARMLKLEGRYIEALNILDMVIKLDNKNTDAYNQKSNILWEMGRLEEAIETMSIAIELEPKNPYFRNNLAWVLLEDGQYEEALEHVNIGIELFGNSIDIEVLDTRGWILYRLGEYDKAISDFSIVIEGNHSIASSQYGMACIYADKGENKKAMEYLEKAFQIDSSYIMQALNEDAFKNIKNTSEFKALVDRYNNEKNIGNGYLALK